MTAVRPGRRAWRPLDPLASIKAKLGVVIVGAVVAAVGALVVTNRLDVPLVVSAPAAALVALAVVQVLATGMTWPLRQMARAAAAMATGDYAQRVTATSRDEVGDLARAFNRMAAELEATDRVRRDLVANVSHELRTPIAALRAVLENLVDGVEQPDRAHLEGMLRQVERLGRLAEQLLELSRFEAGAVVLDRRPVRLSDLAREAVLDALPRAGEGDGPQLSVNVEPDDLVVSGDHDRLYEVVANLLANAVRFSPPGGRVEVRARRQDASVWAAEGSRPVVRSAAQPRPASVWAAEGSRPVVRSAAQPRPEVVVEVRDEGPGIPEGHRERVFERFHRADPARSSTGGGAGLGLAIVAWIVELHGGTVRAESHRPTGCRIVVTLPEVHS